MRKDDLIRLQHMVDAAKEAVCFAQNKIRQDIDTDRMLTLSILKSIEIIGEAAAKVTKGCQEELPQIPWLNIITMRNRLIHGYFDINLDIVWNTVTEDIPPLIAELERIIVDEKNNKDIP